MLPWVPNRSYTVLGFCTLSLPRVTNRSYTVLGFCFKVYHELQTGPTLFWDFVLKSLPRFTNRSYTVLSLCSLKPTMSYKQMLHCSGILCCKVYHELQTDPALFWDSVKSSRVTNRSYTVLGFCAVKSTWVTYRSYTVLGFCAHHDDLAYMHI